MDDLDHLLHLVRYLNATAERLQQAPAPRSDMWDVEAAGKFRDLAKEIERFHTYSIVLLPPESRSKYCSECGRKLGPP